MLLYGSKYLENEQHRDQKKKECYFCTLKTKPLTFMPPSAALLIFLSVRSVPVKIFLNPFHTRWVSKFQSIVNYLSIIIGGR